MIEEDETHRHRHKMRFDDEKWRKWGVFEGKETKSDKKASSLFFF